MLNFNFLLYYLEKGYGLPTMNINPSSNFSVEPTAAFMEIAIPIMRRWEAGEISGEQTLQELNGLRPSASVQDEPANLAQLEQMSSVVYGALNKVSESVAADRIAIELFRKVGNLRLALMSELNIAGSYFARGEAMTALEMYKDTLEEARHANIPSKQAYALQGMSAIYIAQENWAEARQAIEMAEPILLQAPSETTNVHIIICQMYNDLTLVLLKLEEFQKAWDTTRTLARYAKTKNDISAYAYTEAATANVLAALEKHPDADAIIQDLEIVRNPATHYQTAVETFLKKREEALAATILCQYAEYLASIGQYMNGARKAEQAARLYKKLKMEREQTRATALRARLITHSG
jgi:tetratricopeptide (TPR) repeat protein